MKKIISLIIAIILITTCLTSVFANDLPDSWAMHGVNAAKDKRLIPIDMQNKYKSNITREEFCVLIVNFMEVFYNKKITEILHEKDIPISGNYFNDTDNIDIGYAYLLGVVNGVGERMFAPDALITRQEAAVMLTNMSKTLGEVFEINSKEPKFYDSNEIYNWAYEGVNYVVKSEIMHGTASDIFSPLLNYTRQQAYVTFFNSYSFIEKSSPELLKIAIADKEVRIGQGIKYVNKTFGEPIDKFESVYGFSWNVYLNEASEFIMVGFVEDKVKAIATNSYNFIYNDFISNEKEFKDIREPLTEKNYSAVRVIYDQQKIEGIFLVSKEFLSNKIETVNFDTTAKETQYFINSFRIKNGKLPLKESIVNYEVANSHSIDMAKNKYSHTGSDGRTSATRLAQALPKSTLTSENITYGFSDGFGAFEDLINSTQDRFNLLDAHKNIGVAVALNKSNIMYMTIVLSD